VGLIAADQYVGFLFVVDMHVVAWLEDFICDNCDHCVVVLVSHDRYLVDGNWHVSYFRSSVCTV
jgi:hypothetical protein